MSAAGRGGVRRENDAYYTADDVAEKCVKTLDPPHAAPKGSWVLEPHAGGGAFVRAAYWAGAHKVTTIDIVPGWDITADWLTVTREQLGEQLGEPPRGCPGPDVILGNPPYRNAEAHVRHAMAIVRPGGTVAFLLRLGFLEGQKRRAFWDEFPPRMVYALSARPSFTAGGTDASAYGWFVWGGGRAWPRLGWL